MSRLRAVAGMGRGCCAWSGTSWTGVTGAAHAAEACAGTTYCIGMPSQVQVATVAERAGLPDTMWT